MPTTTTTEEQARNAVAYTTGMLDDARNMGLVHAALADSLSTELRVAARLINRGEFTAAAAVAADVREVLA